MVRVILQTQINKKKSHNDVVTEGSDRTAAKEASMDGSYSSDADMYHKNVGNRKSRIGEIKLLRCQHS